MTPDDAPIRELFLTVQFAPPIMALNPIQLAEIYGPFRADYPEFKQIGRAGPMPIESKFIDLVSPFGPPRNSFHSPDRQSTLIFQEDRLSYSWSRAIKDEESNYPGFKTVLARALEDWRLLRSALFTTAPPPQPLIGEIAYMNHFETSAVHNPLPLPSIYNFLNPEFTTSMSQYAFTWYEPHLGSGFLQTQISGPMPSPEGSMLSQLQTIARFRVEDGWEGLGAGFDKSHVTVYDAFKRLINPHFRPV